MDAPARVGAGGNVEPPQEQMPAGLVRRLGKKAALCHTNPGRPGHEGVAVFDPGILTGPRGIKLQKAGRTLSIGFADAERPIRVSKDQRLGPDASRRATPRQLGQQLRGLPAFDRLGPAGQSGGADGFEFRFESSQDRLEAQGPKSPGSPPSQQGHGGRLAPMIFGKFGSRHFPAPGIGQAVGDQSRQSEDSLGSVESHIGEGQTHRGKIKTAFQPCLVVNKVDRPAMHEMAHGRIIPPANPQFLFHLFFPR